MKPSAERAPTNTRRVRPPPVRCERIRRITLSVWGARKAKAKKKNVKNRLHLAPATAVILRGARTLSDWLTVYEWVVVVETQLMSLDAHDHADRVVGHELCVNSRKGARFVWRRGPAGGVWDSRSKGCVSKQKTRTWTNGLMVVKYFNMLTNNFILLLSG